MEEEIKSISTTEGKDKKKIEKRISVEEISNGFIMTESKDYKDSKGEYKYETVKTYHEKNPLDISMKDIMKKNMPGS